MVDEAREAVHAACRRMVADRLVIGSAGNVSMRVDDDHFVVSAGGIRYELLEPTDHPVVDVRDGSWEGRRAPTSELPLHTGLMEARPDVGAIVHTHSRYAAAFAVARLELPFICNESLATCADRVLVTDYAAPGTSALAGEVRRVLAEQPGSRAALLANHGVVAIGPDLDAAYLVAESVEWTAEICHLARTLLAAGSGEHVLDHEVQEQIARTYGVSVARRGTGSTP